MRRRLCLFALLAAGWLLVDAAWNPRSASADPAGPTDYETEIVSLVPEPDGVTPRIIGGDSFVELLVEDREVLVIGYRGEPYLRFLRDGTVEQNALSPSTFLNQDRYGSGEVPPEADPQAPPVWERVAGDGSYAWHDHRAHWMNEARPPGAEPGDQILEAVVPLVVDGEEVSMTVISFLRPAPSIVAPLVGAALAVAALAGLWWFVGSMWAAVGAGGLVAILALVVGRWAVVSVPPETTPSALEWLLPLVAVVSVAAAAVARRSAALASALVALTGVELLIWGWVRREGVRRALLPTDAPYWFDRGVTAAAVVTGLAVLAIGLVMLVRASTGGEALRGLRPNLHGD